MSDGLPAFLDQCRRRVESALADALAARPSPYTTSDTTDLLQGYYTAARYSALDGGKRVRPVLVYGAAGIFGRQPDADLDRLAAAIECIHVYSLVHDDLPAMDDDDLRRGKPTCHRAFGEATAMLVGDGLQATAFELIAACGGIDTARRVELVAVLARAAGERGMVGGQFIDLQATARQIDATHLQTMHELKTGALIRAAVALGAVAAGATGEAVEALDRYAALLGLAFQVKDDLLDVEGDAATLGKQAGADAERNKPTYPSLLGIDGSHTLLTRLHADAVAALQPFGDDSRLLAELADYVVHRSR